MSKMGGITLNEWKKPPGPPFSPVICVLPHIIGNSKSHLKSLNRGGISIALALSLTEVMQRDLFLVITYIVVVFSILVQGLTVGELVKKVSK